MNIKFKERTNPFIDELVNIAWANQGTHQGEDLKVSDRSEEDVFGLINDTNEMEGEDFSYDEPISKKIDLSKFSATHVKKGENDQPTFNRLIVAVDGGIVNLGDFIGGATAFAVRGAAVCIIGNEIAILRYNTGALIIDEFNKVPVLAYIGKKFGNELLYLVRDENGELLPKPSAFETANQIQDRFRNFVERMVLEEVLGIMAANKTGLLLLDGALPAGTFDTPSSYLQDFLNAAAQNSIDIAAISKKTSLTLRGCRIADLFDDYPSFVGFAPLKEALRVDREKLVEQGVARDVSELTLAKELYAARFGLGPPASAFRVDVQNSIRSTPEEVIKSVFNECQIQSCYPKPLVEAHQACSFFYQDTQNLLADIVARTGAVPKEDTSMDWIFQPFGAFGK